MAAEIMNKKKKFDNISVYFSVSEHQVHVY